MARPCLSRFPFLVSLVLALLAPCLAASMAAQGVDQTCQAVTPAPQPDSMFSRDVRKTANQATLLHGTTIGFDDYWTESAESSPELFHATDEDKVFMAGDYPAGTPLETVWADLCPALIGMGTLVEVGPATEGGLYALMILSNQDGTQRYLVAYIHYGYKSDVPVYELVSANPETFWIPSGLSINGLPAFDGLETDTVLPVLQAGATSSGPTGTTTQETGAAESTGTQITTPGGTVISWGSEWMHDTSQGFPPTVTVLLNADGSALMLFEGTAGQTAMDLWSETTVSGSGVLDEGTTPDGGYYQLLFTEASSGPIVSTGPSYTFIRAYNAIPAPILVYLTIGAEAIASSLPAARGVTTNGISILDGVADAALIAVFENGGPTGQPVFTGGDATSTEASSSEQENQSGTDNTSVSVREVIASVPALPPGWNERPESSSTTEEAYTSDLFGYTVAWESPWAPDTDSSEVNEDEGYDYVSLSIDETDGAMASILGSTWDDNYRADDYIDYWASDDYVKENFPEGTEVVLADGRRSSGAVVYVGPLAGEDSGSWVMIYEIVIMDDDLQIEPSFAAPLADFEASYEAPIGSITVNGDSVFGYFPVDEILEALAQAE